MRSVIYRHDNSFPLICLSVNWTLHIFKKNIRITKISYKLILTSHTLENTALLTLTTRTVSSIKMAPRSIGLFFRDYPKPFFRITLMEFLYPGVLFLYFSRREAQKLPVIVFVTRSYLEIWLLNIMGQRKICVPRNGVWQHLPFALPSNSSIRKIINTKQCVSCIFRNGKTFFWRWLR